MLTSYLLGKVFNDYRNFLPFTRTADYPQQSILAKKGKKNRQITCTGGLPKKQKKIVLKSLRTQM